MINQDFETFRDEFKHRIESLNRTQRLELLRLTVQSLQEEESTRPDGVDISLMLGEVMTELSQIGI